MAAPPVAVAEGEANVPQQPRKLEWRSTRPGKNIGWNESDVDPFKKFSINMF